MRFSFISRFASLAAVGGLLVTAATAGANVRIINGGDRPWVMAPAGYSFTLSGQAGRNDACAFPTICIEQGTEGDLGVQLNCTKAGKAVSCGTVTWASKPSTTQLKAKFVPNPSGPPHGKTNEDVTSAKGQKPGTYTQLISWKCTGVSPCTGSATAKIIVSL